MPCAFAGVIVAGMTAFPQIIAEGTLMKKTLLAMLASAALTLVMGNVAFADEPTSQAETAANDNAPIISKQVKDVDGVEVIESDWQDAADCAINASVPFRLSAQLPDDFDTFSTYELTFHDIMAKSLTFEESSLKVYLEDTDGSQIVLFGSDATNPIEGISLVTTDIPKGETFNVIIANAKAIPNITAGTTVYVEYTATLNEKAVTGAIETGNPNRFYVTYPESPTSDIIASSAKALATLFTYKVTIECQNNQGEPLPGAEFKMYKNGNDGYKELTTGQFTPDSGGSIFTAKGIDEGQYKISETATPNGAASIADTYFTIVGTYETGSHGVQLTKYEYILTDEAGNPIEDLEQATFFIDKDKGNLSRTVIHSDTQSSSSQGLGNMIVFVIVAAVIVIGAAITIAAVRKNPPKKAKKNSK